jgi:hypothetical protein
MVGHNLVRTILHFHNITLKFKMGTAKETTVMLNEVGADHELQEF